MTAATPGQALSPDPAGFAYHVRATAFNVLTGKMAGGERHVPRSERDAIAIAVVDAVEPLIRADERAIAAREAHAADGPAGCECGHAQTGHAFSDDVCAVPECPCSGYRRTPQPAPGLAAAMAERDQLREVLAKIRQACERPGDVAGKTSGSGIINGRYLAEHLLRTIGKHPVEDL